MTDKEVLELIAQVRAAKAAVDAFGPTKVRLTVALEEAETEEEALYSTYRSLRALLLGSGGI
jgi:hypothetical protein